MIEQKLSALLCQQATGQKIFQLHIEAGAQVIIEDDMGSALQMPLTIHLQRNSEVIYRLRAVNQEPGLALLQRILTIDLAQEGARAQVQVNVAARSSERVVLKTLQHHRAPHTTSEMVIKGVFLDAAELVSDNLIRIEPEAQHTGAREMNKNLILGDRARVKSIPKIEVEADQVTCEHGAAISRISEQDLFYVQSRGLSRELAQELLIEAFLQ